MSKPVRPALKQSRIDLYRSRLNDPNYVNQALLTIADEICEGIFEPDEHSGSQKSAFVQK